MATRKEVLAQRKELENYYYNCPLQTPEQVAKLFEVYTKLIWNHHQAGLVYDFYYDDTTVFYEGSAVMKGGEAILQQHTLPSFSCYPDNEIEFLDIFCIPLADGGYKFGQTTTANSTFSKNGANFAGRGDNSRFESGTFINFCQCELHEVEGRLVMTEEYLGYGQEAKRRVVSGALPFKNSVLDGREDI